MKISTFSTFKKEYFPRKLFAEIRYADIYQINQLTKLSDESSK